MTAKPDVWDEFPDTTHALSQVQAPIELVRGAIARGRALERVAQAAREWAESMDPSEELVKAFSDLDAAGGVG